MLKSTLFASAVMAVGFLTSVQAALAAPPVEAGGQIQQIPRAPAADSAIPDLRIERGDTARTGGPVGPGIVVRSLRITGETLFSEAELIAVTGFSSGKTLNLRDLRMMAAKISDFYNRRGYFVAQAYLPAQQIQDGAVTIAVIEGHYGRIGLDNRTNLSSGLAHDILSGLNGGDAVAAGPLERRLLLLSDIPGVRVKSTLSPGAVVGASDLNVNLTPAPRLSGSIDGDNAGDPASGADRLGATLNINDPTGRGDLISLRVLSSFDGLDYGRAAYQMQIHDATVGVAYAALDYRLHGAFASLQANGTAEIASVYASYPLIRAYAGNLVLLTSFEDRTFQDKQGATASVVDKDEYAGMVGVAGDHHDALWGGGWNQFSLGLTVGDLNIRTPEARLVDAQTAEANGQYAKISYSVSRLQSVFGPLSLYALVRGQESSKNLDVSEKMELGGAYGVRAYAEGQIYGDEGYVATLEARMLLPPPPPPIPGRLQFIGFVDTGSVSTHSPWFPDGSRQAVSAGGAGVNWAVPNDFVVKATYAHTLGEAVGVPGPNASSRVWVQLDKFF
jgi:hemolysin activation/secretion protein